jgi:hypothetical protein
MGTGQSRLLLDLQVPSTIKMWNKQTSTIVVASAELTQRSANQAGLQYRFVETKDVEHQLLEITMSSWVTIVWVIGHKLESKVRKDLKIISLAAIVRLAEI